jgi:hypothetical protein
VSSEAWTFALHAVAAVANLLVLYLRLKNRQD